MYFFNGRIGSYTYLHPLVSTRNILRNQVEDFSWLSENTSENTGYTIWSVWYCWFLISCQNLILWFNHIPSNPKNIISRMLNFFIVSCSLHLSKNVARRDFLIREIWFLRFYVDNDSSYLLMNLRYLCCSLPWMWSVGREGTLQPQVVPAAPTSSVTERQHIKTDANNTRAQTERQKSCSLLKDKKKCCNRETTNGMHQNVHNSDWLLAARSVLPIECSTCYSVFTI